MPGKIIRADNITRPRVRAGYGLRYYVFGDNMERRGLGGQAGVMRGEPNAIGVPTKWSPSNRPDAYFTDEDWGEGDVERAVYGAFDTVETMLKEGYDVVIPSAGIGTGLADLPAKAPRIYDYITRRIGYLECAYGKKTMGG